MTGVRETGPKQRTDVISLSNNLQSWTLQTGSCRPIYPIRTMLALRELRWSWKTP